MENRKLDFVIINEINKQEAVRLSIPELPHLVVQEACVGPHKVWFVSLDLSKRSDAFPQGTLEEILMIALDRDSNMAEAFYKATAKLDSYSIPAASIKNFSAKPFADRLSDIYARVEYLIEERVAFLKFMKAAKVEISTKFYDGKDSKIPLSNEEVVARLTDRFNVAQARKDKSVAVIEQLIDIGEKLADYVGCNSGKTKWTNSDRLEAEKLLDDWNKVSRNAYSHVEEISPRSEAPADEAEQENDDVSAPIRFH